MSHRDYVNTVVDGGVIQTHFREQGRGAPLVFLHPSPLSSAFMEPLMSRNADLGRVIAPDTAGYGNSDPLLKPSKDLSAYIDWLKGFLDALHLERVVLYGSATGAQIAIEFARLYPQRVRHLLADNAVHFENHEREEIMRHYFPSLSPSADGGHLQQTWQIADALFQRFPWYREADEAESTSNDSPVDLVHATVMGYLQAGEDYARAYRAAFNNERAENLQAVSVPTSVIRWQGSILKTYADRLDEFEWPEHISMVHCGSSPEERFAAIRGCLKSLTSD